MKKNTKFTSGAMIGAAIGIAAGIALSLIDGKKVKSGVSSAKREAALIYKNAAPKLKKLKKLGEKEYHTFIESAVLNFAKAQKISKSETEEILKETKKYWQQIKKHL